MVVGLANGTGRLARIEGFSIFGFFCVMFSSRPCFGGDIGAGLFRDASRASRSASMALRSRPIIPESVLVVILLEIGCAVEITF